MLSSNNNNKKKKNKNNTNNAIPIMITKIVLLGTTIKTITVRITIIAIIVTVIIVPSSLNFNPRTLLHAAP